MYHLIEKMFLRQFFNNENLKKHAPTKMHIPTTYSTFIGI
jgi:hypothetical protein